MGVDTLDSGGGDGGGGGGGGKVQGVRPEWIANTVQELHVATTTGGGKESPRVIDVMGSLFASILALPTTTTTTTTSRSSEGGEKDERDERDERDWVLVQYHSMRVSLCRCLLGESCAIFSIFLPILLAYLKWI